MIAQFVLSALLAAILLYAWTEYRRSPAVALLSVLVATAGLYFVWFPAHSTWVAELALPMIGLAAHFDPAVTWRANFYRVEGSTEPRFYSAWQPTKTTVPNFHVPEAFGELAFAQRPLPRK